MEGLLNNTYSGRFAELIDVIDLIAFSNMGKQNLAMMEQAMKMFAPFSGQQPADAEPEAAAAPRPGREIDDLRRRLDELEKEIGGIGKGSPKK